MLLILLKVYKIPIAIAVKWPKPVWSCTILRFFSIDKITYRKVWAWVILPGSLVAQTVKHLPAMQERRKRWHPTPVLLPGESHGWRSLVGCSPWGHEESDITERPHFHFSLSCIGEGNGNPLQSSCLENPRDGGAWRAAVYGVAQSQTRLKWLSSSSSSNAGDPGLIPGLGRSPGEGNGNPLQYTCLWNPIDKGAW